MIEGRKNWKRDGVDLLFKKDRDAPRSPRSHREKGEDDRTRSREGRCSRQKGRKKNLLSFRAEKKKKRTRRKKPTNVKN